jgi:hypothetical protein
MKQRGKKAEAWFRQRVLLIREAWVAGRIVVHDGHLEGICEDCHEWKPLDADHRQKRSQGGSHQKENIDWICRECHNKRDNMGDPNKKKPNKKADWQKPHYCKKCRRIIGQLLCPYCHQIGV